MPSYRAAANAYNSRADAATPAALSAAVGAACAALSGAGGGGAGGIAFSSPIALCLPAPRSWFVTGGEGEGVDIGSPAADGVLVASTANKEGGGKGGGSGGVFADLLGGGTSLADFAAQMVGGGASKQGVAALPSPPTGSTAALPFLLTPSGLRGRPGGVPPSPILPPIAAVFYVQSRARTVSFPASRVLVEHALYARALAPPPSASGGGGGGGPSSVTQSGMRLCGLPSTGYGGPVAPVSIASSPSGRYLMVKFAYVTGVAPSRLQQQLQQQSSSQVPSGTGTQAVVGGGGKGGLYPLSSPSGLTAGCAASPADVMFVVIGPLTPLQPQSQQPSSSAAPSAATTSIPSDAGAAAPSSATPPSTTAGSDSNGGVGASCVSFEAIRAAGIPALGVPVTPLTTAVDALLLAGDRLLTVVRGPAVGKDALFAVATTLLPPLPPPATVLAGSAASIETHLSGVGVGGLGGISALFHTGGASSSSSSSRHMLTTGGVATAAASSKMTSELSSSSSSGAADETIGGGGGGGSVSADGELCVIITPLDTPAKALSTAPHPADNVAGDVATTATSITRASPPAGTVLFSASEPILRVFATPFHSPPACFLPTSAPHHTLGGKATGDAFSSMAAAYAASASNPSAKVTSSTNQSNASAVGPFVGGGGGGGSGAVLLYATRYIDPAASPSSSSAAASSVEGGGSNRVVLRYSAGAYSHHGVDNPHGYAVTDAFVPSSIALLAAAAEASKAAAAAATPAAAVVAGAAVSHAAKALFGLASSSSTSTTSGAVSTGPGSSGVGGGASGGGPGSTLRPIGRAAHKAAIAAGGPPQAPFSSTSTSSSSSSIQVRSAAQSAVGAPLAAHWYAEHTSGSLCAFPSRPALILGPGEAVLRVSFSGAEESDVPGYGGGGTSHDPASETVLGGGGSTHPVASSSSSENGGKTGGHLTLPAAIASGGPVLAILTTHRLLIVTPALGVLASIPTLLPLGGGGLGPGIGAVAPCVRPSSSHHSGGAAHAFGQSPAAAALSAPSFAVWAGRGAAFPRGGGGSGDYSDAFGCASQHNGTSGGDKGGSNRRQLTAPAPFPLPASTLTPLDGSASFGGGLLLNSVAAAGAAAARLSTPDPASR